MEHGGYHGEDELKVILRTSVRERFGLSEL